MSDHAKRAEPFAVLLLLFLSSVLHAEPLAAQDAGSPGTEAKRSFSPDKRWEFNADTDQPELLKAGTDQVALSFPEDSGYGSPTIQWASDSRRLAFRYSAGREDRISLYQLNGEQWTDLDSPNDSEEIRALVNRATKSEVKRSGSTEDKLRFIRYNVALERWVDPNTAILSAVEHDKGKADEFFIEVGFLLTLKFDHAGDWKIVKTHRMSHEEIRRIESNLDSPEARP